MHYKNKNFSLFFSGGYLFFCGFLLVLNSLVIPYIKNLHELSYLKANLIPFSFYASYFLSAFTLGFYSNKSFLKYIRIGIIIEILASLMMITQENTPSFAIVLTSTIFLGLGVAFIEVYGNPFLASLGTKESISKRLILGHASTAAGMIIAPLLGTRLILHNYFSYLYVIIFLFGTFLYFISFFIHENRMPQLKENKVNHYLKCMKNKYVFFAFLGISISVGIETCCSSFMIEFFSKHPNLNFDFEFSGNISMIFWLLLLLGRLVGPLLLSYIKEERLLLLHGFLGLFLSCIAVFYEGISTLIAILGIGYAISIFFPLIYSITLKKFEKEAATVSSILCMGNLGGAIYPLIQGYMADLFGIKFSFSILVIGFIFLIYYPFRSYLLKNQPISKMNPQIEP